MGLQFINNCRGIAILLVILAHAHAAAPQDPTLSLNLIHYLADNSTILFVVIAGYLFSMSTVDFKYLPFLKNKFLSVILPYFFVTTPAALLYIFKIKTNHWWMDMDWFYSLNPAAQYGYLMATGAHLGPLWFIPMIGIFYLISPLLVRLKNTPVLLPIFLASLALSVYCGRPEFNNNTLIAFIFFLPAYLLGMLLVEHSGWYSRFSKHSALYLPLFLIGMCVFYATIGISDSVDLFFKLAMSIMLFAFCREYADTRIKLLDVFARLSFFLFFVHGYFAGVIRTLFTHGDISAKGAFPVLIFFVLIVTFSLLSYIPAKLVLGKRSKYLLAA